MRPLAILVAGEPVPAALAARGSFSDMIRDVVRDAWPGPWAEIDGRADLPDLERFAGLIVTGSSANVPTREPWILELERYLARAVAEGLPVFGICFGHQLLGQALGGLVTKNPNGREIGTVALELVRPDPLLGGLKGSLQANMTHVDSVVALPPGARVLARSALDENAMVRFAERAWGVQFHPELDRETLAHYVAARRVAMIEEGLNAAAIEQGLADTPASAGILRRFAASLPVSP
jgi:GMP synthase (glutamine-hydrolysing)